MSYSKLYNYEDFISFLSGGGYKDAVNKKKNAYDSALEQQLKALEGQKKTINDNSDELARQAYISYLSTSKELPEKLSMKGFNGGALDNVYLSLANEYQNNYNEIGKDRLNKLNDNDAQMTNARLTSNTEYLKDLSKLYDSAVEKFLDTRESEENRNFESYYNDKELLNKEADRKAQMEKAEADRKAQLAKAEADRKAQTAQNKADREIELAKLAYQAGDPSLLEKLGIKPSSNSASGSSSNSSSNSSSGSSSNINDDVSISDLAKQLDYAVALAKYGNYSLFCSITGMSEEEAALTFAEKNKGYSESQIRDAAKLFMSGDFNNNVLGILKSAYPDFSYPQIWEIWRSIAEQEWMMQINDTYKGPKS